MYLDQTIKWNVSSYIIDPLDDEQEETEVLQNSHHPFVF
jgi:hypothetical protein